jgi:hypothetical protein
MDPNVAGYFFARSIIERLDVVLFSLLFFVLCPGEGGFEHASRADEAVGGPSLYGTPLSARGPCICVSHSTYHQEISLGPLAIPLLSEDTARR